jgi:hypothetical protein
MWHQYYVATRSVARHGVKRGDYLRTDLDIDSANPTLAHLIRGGIAIARFSWEEWCDVMVPAGATPVSDVQQQPFIQTELDLAS